MNASVRHLGTDINYLVLENLYAELKEKVDFYFDSPVDSVAAVDGGYQIFSNGQTYECEKVYYFCRKKRKQMDGADLSGAADSHQLEPG